MRIGKLSAETGISTKTIRYYEEIGLLPVPAREPSGYRSYEAEDVQRLEFINKAKLLGLTLEEVGDVLQASDPEQMNCEHVLGLLEEKLAQIDAWLQEAHEMREVLDHTISAARERIGEDASGAYHCPVIERGLHERALHAGGAKHELAGVAAPMIAESSGVGGG